MGDFGENLRREREARGITLENISAVTRIRVGLLEAIENEAFGRLPGGVFNVNFVRQYARQVGLDEEQVVAEFRRLAAPPEEPPAEERAAAVASEYEWDRPSRARAWALAILGLAVVTVTASAWVGWRVWKSRAAPAKTAAPQAVETSPAPPADAALRLELLAREMVWLSVHADGAPLFETTLQGGQSRLVTARSEIRLRVGNAGGLQLKLNGTEQPPLGPPGQRMTVDFTPEGMRVVSSTPRPVNP